MDGSTWHQFLDQLESLPDSHIQLWIQQCLTKLNQIQSTEELQTHIYLLYPSTFDSVWKRLDTQQKTALQDLVSKLERQYGPLLPYFQAHNG